MSSVFIFSYKIVISILICFLFSKICTVKTTFMFYLFIVQKLKNRKHLKTSCSFVIKSENEKMKIEVNKPSNRILRLTVGKLWHFMTFLQAAFVQDFWPSASKVALLLSPARLNHFKFLNSIHSGVGKSLRLVGAFRVPIISIFGDPLLWQGPENDTGQR